MKCALKFKWHGGLLTANLDSKTREWDLQGDNLSTKQRKEILDLLYGPESGGKPISRSPSEGFPWVADMTEAAERVKGTYQLPDVLDERLDVDTIY